MIEDRDQFEPIPLELPYQVERLNHVLASTELASMLSCSAKQPYKMAAANRLPQHQIGSLIRLSARAAAEWLRTRRCGPLRMIVPRTAEGCAKPDHLKQTHPAPSESRPGAYAPASAAKGVMHKEETGGRND